jgi:hypothetical protein
MNEVNLVLPADDVGMVLAALAKAPYEQVHDLIGRIRAQAIPQIQAAQQAMQEAKA